MFKVFALLIMLSGPPIGFESKESYPDAKSCGIALETRFAELDKIITEQKLPVSELKMQCRQVGPPRVDA